MSPEKNRHPFKYKYYGHLPYALILVAFLTAFFITENIISEDYPGMFLSHLPIDDLIPFWDFAVIFYVLWFPMLFAVGFYLLFRDVTGFKRYMTYIGFSFFSVIIICLIFPNYQDMRPEGLTGSENIFTWVLVNFIYGNDTCTNVLPSAHVLGCFAFCFGVLYNETLRKIKWITIPTVVLGVLISASTVFVKQHSVLDIIAAVPVGIIWWFVVYKLMFRGKKSKELSE